MKMTTRSGRTLNVTRLASHDLPAATGRVVLDTSRALHDGRAPWLSLTAEEARRLAALLIFQAATIQPAPDEPAGRVDVTPVAGDAFEIRARGHVITTDQPRTDGGTDTAATPVELFVASIASCTAHYAGRYLDRHGLDRDGLAVRADFRMADDRPARVAALSVTVQAPSLPADRLPALRAVVSHCTVSNTLARPPEVQVHVRCEPHGEDESRRAKEDRRVDAG
ncbi:OsmC family protein [Streptomyces sp. NPDC023723]|uniref:OsmC family protein n=1 Tax=Streptomyces sp. NPDC023723 TaxID=3154323 RepID=UPI0033E6C634